MILADAISSEDWTKVQAVCLDFLSVHPGDPTHLHSLVVAYILDQRYTEALKISQTFKFEHLYCMYQTNQRFLHLIDAADKINPYIIHLQAQEMYRLEMYKEINDLYSVENLECETMVNLTASIAAMGVESKNEMLVDNQTYEQLYNNSLVFLSRGRYVKSLQNLELALGKCPLQMGRDGSSLKEIQSEMQRLHSVIAFVYEKVHLKSNALKSYSQIIKEGCPDLFLETLVAHNLTIIHGNIVDSQSSIKLLLAEKLEVKLNKMQNRIIATNSLKIDFGLGKVLSARINLKSLLKTYSHDESLILMQAIVTENGSDCTSIETAQQLIMQNQMSSLFRLNLIHANIEQLMWDGAEFLLNQALNNEDGSFVTRRAYLLSTLLYVYEKTKSYEKSIVLLKGIIMGSKDVDQIKLEAKKRLAKALFLNKDYTEAMCAYKELCKSTENPSSFLISQLILATSNVDLEAVYEMESLINSCNLSYKVHSESELAELKVLPLLDSESVTIAKRRRKAKKFPKGYDINIIPDPERWLPKAQRSLNNKKQKKNPGYDQPTQGLTVTMTGETKSDRVEKSKSKTESAIEPHAQAHLSPSTIESSAPIQKKKKKGKK